MRAHFDARLAFDFPPHAFRLDRRFLFGLGAALGIAMYDFLGYYQVCYLGDEVADAPRTIPRSILISVAAVALVYFAMNGSILGVLPWREVVASRHVASDMMLRLFGPAAAAGVTVTSYGRRRRQRSPHFSVIAASRTPRRALGTSSADWPGPIPRANSHTVPYSLADAALATLACLSDLSTVIAALLCSRILIQFVGQTVTVFYLRPRPELPRMLFLDRGFSSQAVVALAGWLLHLWAHRVRG